MIAPAEHDFDKGHQLLTPSAMVPIEPEYDDEGFSQKVMTSVRETVANHPAVALALAAALGIAAGLLVKRGGR